MINIKGQNDILKCERVGETAEGAAGGFSTALRHMDPGCLAIVIAWGALCFVNLSILALVVARAVVRAPSFWMTSRRPGWSSAGLDCTSSEWNCDGGCDFLLRLARPPFLEVERGSNF